MFVSLFPWWNVVAANSDKGVFFGDECGSRHWVVGWRLSWKYFFFFAVWLSRGDFSCYIRPHLHLIIILSSYNAINERSLDISGFVLSHCFRHQMHMFFSFIINAQICNFVAFTAWSVPWNMGAYWFSVPPLATPHDWQISTCTLKFMRTPWYPPFIMFSGIRS